MNNFTSKSSLLTDSLNALLGKWDNDDFNLQILRSISNIFPSMNAAILFLYDTDNNKFIIKEVWGIEKNIKNFAFIDPNDGLCSKIFLTGKGVILSDLKQHEEFYKENSHLLDFIKIKDENKILMPESLIGLPVKTEKRIWGVMILCSFSLDSGLQMFDYDLGQLMANLLALHIECKEMELKREEINIYYNNLKDVEDMGVDSSAFLRMISNQMGELFIKGEGFDAILELTEKYISYPIALYNTFMERICCTANAINKDLPENLVDLFQTQELMRSKKKQIIRYGSDILHLLPIKCNNLLSGFIAIWASSEKFSVKQQLVLENTCQYIAYIWVKISAVTGVDHYLKNEVLTEILSGRQDENILNKAGSLGMETGNNFFVIIVTREDIENYIEFCIKLEGALLIDNLITMLRKKGLSCISIPELNNICLIVSYRDIKRRNNRYDNIVDDVLTEAEKSFPQLMIGCGRIYTGIYNIRKSYREAAHCLEIINKYFIHRSAIYYGDIGVLRLLLTQKKEDIDAYLEDILGPVIEYDKKQNSDLLATLFYYARSNKSVTTASSQLNIHINTLYYRIKKAEELMGFNFEHPMDWFDVQAASIMYGLMNTDLITKT